MGHPVMWFEVLGNNADALRTFYGQLFGWSFKADNPARYGVVDTGDRRGIPGGVGQPRIPSRSWTTFYVETPDVTAALAQAERLGGKVVMPRTVLPDVTLGLFEDPEGHVIGVVEPDAPAA